jgi:hypothetical protein
MPTFNSIRDHQLSTITSREIEFLSDRLFARAVSSLTNASQAERLDLETASRVLRRLLSAYERGTGRQLLALLIDGGH